jgi:hypothetical protein
VLGEAAAAAAKTDTFLGERYRRLVKRRGKLKALVAVARSILVIVWHLLADPTARFHDLGADFYTNRTDTDRKTRNHIRQLQALGFTVTLTRPPDRHQPTTPTVERSVGCCRPPATGAHFPISRQPSTACWPVLSLQVTSGESSSQYAPDRPSNTRWNDRLTE